MSARRDALEDLHIDMQEVLADTPSSTCAHVTPCMALVSLSTTPNAESSPPETSAAGHFGLFRSGGDSTDDPAPVPSGPNLGYKVGELHIHRDRACAYLGVAHFRRKDRTSSGDWDGTSDGGGTRLERMINASALPVPHRGHALTSMGLLCVAITELCAVAKGQTREVRKSFLLRHVTKRSSSRSIMASITTWAVCEIGVCLL